MNNLSLLSALKSANSILMCTHISPDGDAIGSMLAAGHIMKKLGKNVVMACDDPMPARYRFLHGASEVVMPEDLQRKSFDLSFAIDAADEKRLGKCAEYYMAAPVRVQIDHHKTNPLYAQHNEVDGDASSAGCMVWRLLKALDMEPDQQIAACIYAAISTDTGNFSFSNTDAETFACAAAMAETGFDLNAAARNVHLLKETAHVKLLGCALNSLRFFADGQCSCMTLKPEDYETSHASNEHCDGIINYALNVPGVKMTYLMDEKADGTLKISFRAVEPYHVSDIAAVLGGGGHVLAAGCRTDMPKDEAVRMIEESMIKQIEERT